MEPEVFYNHTEADTIYLEVCVSQPNKQQFEYKYAGLTFVLLTVVGVALLWRLRR